MILPATPLLVPGVAPGLRADPLADVRDAVARALTELTAGGVLPLVLAHGTVLRHGLLRPSLAGSGIGDRWLPDAAGHWADRARPAAGTGASVALLALADVLGGRAAEIETVEVPPGTDRLEGRPLDLLRRAAAVVVAGGGAPGGQASGPDALTGGVRAALRAAGADEWATDVQVFEQAGDHLPLAYQVTRLTDRKIAV